MMFLDLLHGSRWRVLLCICEPIHATTAQRDVIGDTRGLGGEWHVSEGNNWRATNARRGDKRRQRMGVFEFGNRTFGDLTAASWPLSVRVFAFWAGPKFLPMLWFWIFGQIRAVQDLLFEGQALSC